MAPSFRPPVRTWGRGRAAHPEGRRAGVPAAPAPRTLNASSVHRAWLSGASASPGQQPHCADTGSQQLLGLRGRGYGLSPSPGSCSASQDGHPGGLAQLHPGAHPRLGGQGHSLQAAGRQNGGSPAASACLPACPARARSCARLYLRHSAAARLHSLDAPSLLPLTTGLGLADSWEGQQGRWVAFSWVLCL